MATKPEVDPCVTSNGKLLGPKPWIPFHLRERETDDVLRMLPGQAIRLIHTAILYVHEAGPADARIQPATDKDRDKLVGYALPGAACVWLCTDTGPYLLATDLTSPTNLRLTNPSTGEFANVRGDRVGVLGDGRGVLPKTIGTTSLGGLLSFDEEPFDLMVVASLAVTDSLPSDATQ